MSYITEVPFTCTTPSSGCLPAECDNNRAAAVALFVMATRSRQSFLCRGMLLAARQTD